MTDRRNCPACERESPNENHGWMCTRGAGCVEAAAHRPVAAMTDTDIDALAARMQEAVKIAESDPLWAHHAFAHKHTSAFAEYEEATSPANVLRVLADRARLKAELAQAAQWAREGGENTLAILAEKDAEIAALNARNTELIAEVEARTEERDAIETPMTEICELLGNDDCDDAPGAVRRVLSEADALCARVAELEAAQQVATIALRTSLNVTESFERAIDALETHDPDAPNEMAVLRSSLDYWTRSLGMDNDEVVSRDSVSVSDLKALRQFRIDARAALGATGSPSP